MQIIEQYKTHDNRIHTSLIKARDHCYAHAYKELKDLLDNVFNLRLDNTYSIAQAIILHDDTLKTLKSIVAWMEDLNE